MKRLLKSDGWWWLIPSLIIGLILGVCIAVPPIGASVLIVLLLVVITGAMGDPKRRPWL